MSNPKPCQNCGAEYFPLKSGGFGAVHKDGCPISGPDPVTAPAHYAGDGVVECKRALRSMLSPAKVSPEAAYWWGCAFKYLWRWRLKNGLQDLDKCAECLRELRQTAERDGVK